MKDEQDELLTPQELADFLKIPLSGVYRLSHLKTIPTIRLSHRALRFSKLEVTKWLAERSQPAKGGGSENEFERLPDLDGKKRKAGRETSSLMVGDPGEKPAPLL